MTAPAATATNHLTYPGDVTAGVAVGDQLGVDSEGYPYRVASVYVLGEPPAADATVVGLEPWPLTDLPGLERVVARRQVDTAARASLRALFTEGAPGA